MELCLICIYIHNLGHCVMKYCMSRTCDTLIAHWIRYSEHPPREQHPVGTTRSHLSFDFSCVWSLLDLHKSLWLISVVYMGPTSLPPLPQSSIRLQVLLSVRSLLRDFCGFWRFFIPSVDRSIFRQPLAAQIGRQIAQRKRDMEREREVEKE